MSPEVRLLVSAACSLVFIAAPVAWFAVTDGVPPMLAGLVATTPTLIGMAAIYGVLSAFARWTGR